MLYKIIIYNCILALGLYRIWFLCYSVLYNEHVKYRNTHQGTCVLCIEFIKLQVKSIFGTYNY